MKTVIAIVTNKTLLFRTHPKVQNSKPGDSSISSIPEELLFPDPPGPVQYQETRPANIISPPVHKFPKLSPDSGLTYVLNFPSNCLSFQASQALLIFSSRPRYWRLETSTNLLASCQVLQTC